MKKATMEYLEMAIIPEALEKMEETDSSASKKRASRTKKCCVPTEKTIRAKRRKQNARAKRKTQKTLTARGFFNNQERWWSKCYIPSERYDFLERQQYRDKFYKSEDQKYKKFLGTVDLEELNLEMGVTADCVDNENAVEDEKERFAECFIDCFDAFMADPKQFIVSTRMYAIEEKAEFIDSLDKYLKAVAKVLEMKKVL